MKIVQLFLMGALLTPPILACSQQQPVEIKQEKITVTGTALHAKAGAVVETPKGVYYIKGKSDWGNLYGKKVKVTGTTEKITQNEKDLKNEKGEYIQGFSGTVTYIVNAKVVVVK